MATDVRRHDVSAANSELRFAREVESNSSFYTQENGDIWISYTECKVGPVEPNL